MTWTTSQQLQLFVRFLEPMPPVNRRGNLGLSYLCFYQSELKGLGQTINYLRQVRDGTTHLNAADRSTVRYRNTLQNLGLIAATGGQWGISTSGQELLRLADDRGVDRATLTEEANRAIAVELETAIFRSLLNEVLSQPDPRTRSSEYMLDLLARIQQLVDAVPSAELDAASNDLDLLLFLQAISASGYEVPRFYRLSEAEREEARRNWHTALASADFPTTAPTDLLKAMLYTYQDPLHSNRIQNDIRYRVHGAVRAYLTLREELGDAFPRLNADLQIIEYSRRSQNLEGTRYRLPPREPLAVPFSRQRIISGCPGAGKSTRLMMDLEGAEGTDSIIRRAVFHSDTSYYDFVGCYKPTPVYEQTDAIILNRGGELFQPGRPCIDYRYVPGIFTDALLLALKNATHNVYLLIEELNRGHCSAIFGDMLQLLDRKADGTSEYQITPDPDLGMYLRSHHVEGPLSLPANLFIWATMNAADEGVFPVDSAFKRRWDFEYLGFDSPCAYGADPLRYGGADVPWDTVRTAINQALVSAGVHEDKLVGPYFLSADSLTSPAHVANKLFLYLWDDALRFRRDLLFTTASFNELLAAWDNGNGVPLSIELPEAG